MLIVHQFALYLHIIIGAIALIVFWVPVVTVKGSPQHRLWGKIFTWCMWLVSVSGIVMCLIVIYDPLAIRYPSQHIDQALGQQLVLKQRQLSEFLLMLSVLVLANIRHSSLVLAAKQHRERLRSGSHLLLIGLLAATGGRVLYTALTFGSTLYLIFSLIVFSTVATMLFYIFKPTLKPREWVLEHMSTILGAGIAVYTAFFAVGGRHWLAQLMPGAWQLVPWLLPAVVGTLGILFYKKQLNHCQARGSK
ncbi:MULTISPECIES: hypothetical protein [unclassified Pseudoalteromonas]|uniref:hypothetical protein n=1 Tax=unclassified Pseudoalteromonas TaxID=194690 RepID=UPI000C7E53CC|nr:MULTISPECIES: hypothetical protein [unclassified Pseudoalteromonas]AUJ69237.1 hypothetical protein PNC201_04595 [Pseudoalteromonas sp. NC201]MCX2769332.1 hypothetical protein [Pseudoalteromonas sp. B530]